MIEGVIDSYPALNWSYPPWNYELRPIHIPYSVAIGVNCQGNDDYNLYDVMVLGVVRSGEWTTLTANGTVNGPVVYYVEAQKIITLYGKFTAYYLDEIGPTYSGITINTTIPGSRCLFSCYWTHPGLYGLSTYVFSVNQTGTWVNTTGTFAGYPTSSWSNVTETLPTTAGVTVGFEWYANSTGVWTTTGIWTFIT